MLKNLLAESAENTTLNDEQFLECLAKKKRRTRFNKFDGSLLAQKQQLRFSIMTNPDDGILLVSNA